MNSNKNLIEILNIEGNEVAVSRQGVNNCMVNLTQMAKPYGKLPKDWLKLKSTQEYLQYRSSKMRNGNQERWEDSPNDECSSNSPITCDKTYGGQIIVMQGGNAKEQGTWCTDFHIALDFALWLDPVRKDIVYDVFIKFLTGRNVGTLVNTRKAPAPKYRDGFLPLEAALRKYTSLDDLKRIAEECRVTLHHVKDTLKGNKVSNPVLRKIIDRAKANKAKGLAFPDWRVRKPGINYNQAMLDLFPAQVVGLDGKEG